MFMFCGICIPKDGTCRCRNGNKKFLTNSNRHVISYYIIRKTNHLTRYLSTNVLHITINYSFVWLFCHFNNVFCVLFDYVLNYSMCVTLHTLWCRSVILCQPAIMLLVCICHSWNVTPNVFTNISNKILSHLYGNVRISNMSF